MSKENPMHYPPALVSAICASLLATASALAPAQTAPAAAPSLSSPPPFGAPVTVYAGTKEFVWTLYVLDFKTERVGVVVQVPAMHVHGRRWDYELPSLESKRFKLGQVA